MSSTFDAARVKIENKPNICRFVINDTATNLFLEPAVLKKIFFFCGQMREQLVGFPSVVLMNFHALVSVAGCCRDSAGFLISQNSIKTDFFVFVLWVIKINKEIVAETSLISYMCLSN